MNPEIKEAAYETIRNARDLKKILKPSMASEVTLKMYDREVHRLISKYQTRSPAQLFAAICDTTSKRTYFRRLAATKHFVQARLADALSEQDKRQRAGDHAAWLSSVAVVEFLIGLQRTIEQHRGSCPLMDPKPRKSKRRSLRALPSDFREQMHDALKTSMYRLPFLVAAVTGCRPEELQTGVTVELDDTHITMTIAGAKVKGTTQGQAWRKIGYDADTQHPLVRELVDELSARQVRELNINVNSKVNFTSALRRAGRRLWPQNKVDVTGYSLRHAAASNWKEFLSPHEVSQALGHCVDKTSSTYGQRQISRSSGGLQPSKIQAARTVKATRSVSHGYKNRVAEP
ncbi:MAG: site-specific integrase [Telluria sp.]|nr:site-specific integrase [Telluria sp.]